MANRRQVEQVGNGQEQEAEAILVLFPRNTSRRLLSVGDLMERTMRALAEVLQGLDAAAPLQEIHEE